MPDWDCPAGDYTASGTDEAETAKILVDHLVKMHCRVSLPTGIDTNIWEALSASALQTRVKAGPAKTQVEAKRH